MIGDNTIIIIKENCPKLKFFDLKGVLHLNDASLIPLVSDVNTLEALYLREILDITPTTLLKIAEKLQKLKILNLDDNENIDDNGITNKK